MGKPDGSLYDSEREGGICVLTGGKCFTFIPTNTALDGTITKALQGLIALSNELTKNPEIDDLTV
jgi:hypothetical protein